MTPARSPKKAAFLVAASIVALGAVLVYRWRSLPFRWDQFFETLTRVNYGWLGAAISLMLFSYVVRALRWEVMLRPLRADPSLAGLISATVIGFTAVVLLGRPGEVVRPYLIAMKERVSFSSQMAAWLLERILDSMMVLLIFGFALEEIPGRHLHLSGGLAWVLRAGGYIIAAICSVCVPVLVLFRNFSATAKSRILSALTFLPERYLKRVSENLDAFVEGMQSTREAGFLARLLAYTGLEWMVLVGSYYLLFLAFAATAGLGLVGTLIFVGFLALGSIVQIPGIGGGLQVATVVVLTEIFRMSLEVASGMALLIWVLSVVVVVPFGLLCAFHEGINWNKFKHLPEDVAIR